MFARINTQADQLVVGDILAGGFNLTGMNNPDAVYGSLYLSPTGGSGSTVMINMSPLTRSGSEGTYVYSFDLTTPCDVKLRPTGGDWGDAQYTGTFGGAIDWVNANEPNNYAAFFGPQIGMSNTSGTTFTIWRIALAVNPPVPTTTTTAEQTTTIAETTTTEVTTTVAPPESSTTTVEETTTSIEETTTVEPATTTVEPTTTIEVTTTIEQPPTTTIPETTTTTTVFPGLVYELTFTTASDYYLDGDWSTGGGMYLPVITALTEGGHAYVPPRPWINHDDDPPYGSDWAAVFARINTQADQLVVGDILAGGFNLTGMNNPDAVYGSLYLSPTGGSGSTVMINMSPLTRSGSEGTYVYSFDLTTPCDVKLRPTGGDWGDAQYTGTFGGAIDWVNANEPNNYAAFFGPQIGMSNTSGTTFTIWRIALAVNPPVPTTTTTAEQTTTIAETTTTEVTTTVAPPESSTTTIAETTTIEVTTTIEQPPTTTIPETTTTTTVFPGLVYESTFTTASDYYLDGDWSTGGGMYLPVITALTEGGHAYVPPRPWINHDDDPPYGSDWAAVFARINTQADQLVVGDILAGGFNLTGMNNPDAVYGSLYLSPTGGSGSTVMINMSPLTRSGSEGTYVYSFDLTTPCDVKLRPTGGDWGDAQYTGTFGGAIDWVNANEPNNYAAFFGPQIGMSNTSGTTFTIWRIALAVNPPVPTTTTTAEQTTTIAETTTTEVTTTVAPPESSTTTIAETNQPLR